MWNLLVLMMNIKSLFRYSLQSVLCGYCIYYMVLVTKPSFIFIKFGAWSHFFVKV